MSDRFNASILFGHQNVLSSFVGRLQAGVAVVPTAQELADLGNLAGALNYWAAQAKPSLPVQIAPEFVNGAPRYVFSTYSDLIVAIPFRIPATWTTPTGMASAAEYQWGGTRHHYMNLSRTAGDMVIQSSGLQVTQFFEAGKDFAAGELVYANIWHSAQDPAPCGAGFSVTFPR